MSVVNSKKNIVLPNNEEIMVGPDTILYETIPSRENCSTGNISFLVQNKGQNSLLDAEVYLEVFFKLNYKDTNNAAKQPDWTDATTPFLARARRNRRCCSTRCCCTRAPRSPACARPRWRPGWRCRSKQRSVRSRGIKEARAIAPCISR